MVSKSRRHCAPLGLFQSWKLLLRLQFRQFPLMKVCWMLTYVFNSCLITSSFCMIFGCSRREPRSYFPPTVQVAPWTLHVVTPSRYRDEAFLAARGGYGPENAKLAWFVGDHCSVYESWRRTKTTLENPDGSKILTDSRFAEAAEDSQIYSVKLDQCRHGACDQDERRLPNQKTTTLVCLVIKFSTETVKRCQGELKCIQHGELQGKGKGISRTALSAVYPWSLCSSMMQDIITSLIVRYNHY